MTYYIKAKKFLLESEYKQNGYLHVQNGRFHGFVDHIPANVKVMDFGDFIVAPGLFDTHIHGINGFDVMDGTIEAIQGISEAILPLGVTRFLPTTLTSSREDLEKAIVAVKGAVNEGLPGDQSMGIFLEGPYFTEKHKGAQNPIHFLDPNIDDLNHWQELADGHIIKIALAPERNGALEFTKQATDTGVKVGIAHTDASYDCCNEAVYHGANMFIHLFNGMSGLHHRNPGVVGAALGNKTVFTELICDGHHVHPDVAALSYEVKKDKLMLITDCMRAGLLEDGKYMLGEFEVSMREGIARTESGALAGSTLTLIEAVRNLQTWSGEDLHKIWHLASLSPAKGLGLDHFYGSIVSGKIADFVVIDDNLQVQAIAIGGEIKYQ